MLRAGEDELACDFAETYHVLDFRTLPARQAARLACGLRPSSRIKQLLSGAPADLDTILLAMIADAARLLVWQNTEDGQKGRNQPRSILTILRNDAPETGSGFDTVEEFQAWRASMIGGDSSA